MFYLHPHLGAFFIPLKIIENNLHFIWWIQILSIHLLNKREINHLFIK